MGPGPDEVDEIRQQIDESRQNLGEAVGALAYKADIKNRGKEALEDKKEGSWGKLPGGGDGEGGIDETIKSKLPSGEDVSDKVDALKSNMPDGAGEAASRVGDKAPSSRDVKAKAQEAAATAGEHPIAMAAGAAVAGLAAGLALPETDLERQKLAPAAQDARAGAGRCPRRSATGKSRRQGRCQQRPRGRQAGRTAIRRQARRSRREAANKTQDQVNPSS